MSAAYHCGDLPLTHAIVTRLDGIDISQVGLDDLRNSVVSLLRLFQIISVTDPRVKTIVSQDVALFSGSVKSNLDPFGEHSDAECWDVLERCHLTAPLTQRGGIRLGAITSLEMNVSSGGSSFSAGQRQLLALARAMLRRSSFVILDEASSSIDLATDDQVSC